MTDFPTLDLVDDAPAYQYQMRNEPRRIDEAFGTEIDPETGWRMQRWFIGTVRNDPRAKPMTVFLDPIPHVRLDQNIPLRGWYKGLHEPDGVRARPCYTDAILTQPYGGTCSVGCGFCYINNGPRGYRGQGVTTVDPLYGEKVRRQLKGMRRGAAVYMSSFIDPFLELEAHYGNTRATAEAAVAVGLPIFFLTRKFVPGWAYDLLRVNPHSYMQFSINTPDPEDWRRLSPNAVSLDTMFQQVRAMKAAGIFVSIQVNPIVFGITTVDQVVELAHLLAEAGADHLIFKAVEIVYPSVKGMVRNMRARFGPERAAAFEALFTQNIGGVRTIEESFRVAAWERLHTETKKAGVTMSLCYEYVYERDASGEVVSKTGVSIGGRFLTADQCHGHRVPIYTRRTGAELFTPLAGCPPSGCLTCASSSGGAARVPCGDELQAAAPAMRPNDLKVPIGQGKA